MARHAGKGSRHQRRVSAIERKETRHQEFVGGAEEERAGAEARKRDRQDAEQEREVVRRMADELEAVAGLAGDGAIGPEFPLRIPRSVEEAKEIAREAPEALREKARERLEKMPEPAQKAARLAGSAAGVLLAPLRIGLQIAREIVRLPFSVFRALRQREA